MTDNYLLKTADAQDIYFKIKDLPIVDYHCHLSPKEIYEDKEYVDGTELAQKFFAPIQELLYENSESAVEYAKKQTALIKKEFAKKFDELDAVLQSKLKELEICAKDNENIEARIKETQERLDWLEKIQNKVNGILEI